MNFTTSTFGWLVPVWILGAPLVAAVVMLMTSPKRSHRSSTSPDASDRTVRPGMVGGRDTPTPLR